MPTTPNGTYYTIEEAPVGGRGKASWMIAHGHRGDANIPTLVYAHGSGGSYNQFATLEAWATLRNWLIDHGWLIIEGTGGGAMAGPSNWGNYGARVAYPAYEDHVKQFFRTGPTFLLGRSMGGLVTAWMYVKSGREYAGWINNSGVSTLFTGTSSGTKNSGSNSAYYFSSKSYPAYGASTYAEMREAADGAAPERWSPTVWNGRNILCCYGTADPTVPFSTRGAGPLRTRWAGRLAIDAVEARSGGDHSASNGSYHQVRDMTDFLQQVLEATPDPEPPAIYYVGSSMKRYSGGQLYDIPSVKF